MAVQPPKRSFGIMILSFSLSMLGSVPMPQSWKNSIFNWVVSAMEKRGR